MYTIQDGSTLVIDGGSLPVCWNGISIENILLSMLQTGRQAYTLPASVLAAVSNGAFHNGVFEPVTRAVYLMPFSAPSVVRFFPDNKTFDTIELPSVNYSTPAQRWSGAVLVQNQNFQRYIFSPPRTEPSVLFVNVTDPLRPTTGLLTLPPSVLAYQCIGWTQIGSLLYSTSLQAGNVVTVNMDTLATSVIQVPALAGTSSCIALKDELICGPYSISRPSLTVYNVSSGSVREIAVLDTPKAFLGGIVLPALQLAYLLPHGDTLVRFNSTTGALTTRTFTVPADRAASEYFNGGRVPSLGAIAIAPSSAGAMLLHSIDSGVNVGWAHGLSNALSTGYFSGAVHVPASDKSGRESIVLIPDTVQQVVVFELAPAHQ